MKLQSGLATSCQILWLVATSASLGTAQSHSTSKGEPPIQDNSFLLEEAYNQEAGIVQHISTFSRMWNSKDWTYTFTQEWPGRRNPRHQFSYTLIGMHAGAAGGTGFGWGDIAIHYRYQLVGDGTTRFAFAPRLSMLLPTGDVTRGRGAGTAGMQTNLPVSIVWHRRLVSHSNAGLTYLPHARAAGHSLSTSAGYNLGQGLIMVIHPKVNLLLEVTDSRFQSVVETGKILWARVTYVSPGVRWAHNFSNGLQMVSGIAIPTGIVSSAGERGVLLYLSFEHPFRRFYRDQR